MKSWVSCHIQMIQCFFVDLLTLKHDWLAFLCSFEGFIWRIWQSECYLKIKSFRSDKFVSVSAWNTTRRMYCEVWGEVLTIVNSLPKNQYSPPVQIKHLFYSLLFSSSNLLSQLYSDVNKIYKFTRKQKFKRIKMLLFEIIIYYFHIELR